jgi:hypothetical protein
MSTLAPADVVIAYIWLGLKTPTRDRVTMW